MTRVEVIEGRRTLVVERTPPIPPSLALLLEGGRGPDGRPWRGIRVIRRLPLRLGGASGTCMSDDHRLADWLEGFHVGSDGKTRQLRLLACQDCGAVCVRDVSFDTMPGLVTGRNAPRRRDHVLGWYSGARANQRTYT